MAFPPARGRFYGRSVRVCEPRDGLAHDAGRRPFSFLVFGGAQLSGCFHNPAPQGGTMDAHRTSNRLQPESCAPLPSHAGTNPPASSPKRFLLVELGNSHDWGLMVNEGTAEIPVFRVMLKSGRAYAERLLAELNRESQAGKAIPSAEATAPK